MFKESVDSLTINIKENMSKIFHNPNVPPVYSLTKELIEIENELTVLEKKIQLGNDLLAKVDDKALISKLEKQKEGFESEKNKLNNAISKINKLNSSIEDFILFFIFIRRFYTLAILKQNFENVDKIPSAKLINKLKKEEDLYNDYIDGGCFSKILLFLDFEPYQSYFKDFAKNFFKNIHYTSDSYINSLLRLKALFFEFTHFNTDKFNLTEIKFFLSKNIPIGIPLPETNYELVALHCFFFYELLVEFLTLKPVTTYFGDLKNAVNLDLAIINYKPNTKNTLISSLNNLKEALQKITNKHDMFLSRKALVDKASDINQVLSFYKDLKNKIEIIFKKSKTLIDNKHLNLEKMQHLLAIFVDEANLPKFIEVFNRTIGNDFSLSLVENPNIIGTNKEALSFLFNLLCRDDLFTPFNKKICSFIKTHEEIEICSKADVSILESLRFEDLIEFSFYYLFNLLYADFNSSLSEFNTRLSYCELVASNVFFNIKLQSLEDLLTKRKKEIKKFIGKSFKNEVEFNLHRKKILEDIKLSLETIQDLNRSLSEMKSLETFLISKINVSLIPMPEKYQLLDLVRILEEKKKICNAEHQEVEKLKFINKYKLEKLEINEVRLKEILKIKNNKSMEELTEVLSRLSENLLESLKHIKDTTQNVNRFRQKISSSFGKLSSSIQKLLSSLSTLENPEEMQDLSSLSLQKLLQTAEDLVKKKNLFGKADFKKKLTVLQELLNCPDFSMGVLINLIISKYHKCDNTAKNILPEFLNRSKNSQFFSKQPPKKKKHLMFVKLFNEYVILKEQSSWLEKLFNLIKFEADDRIIKLFAMRAEAEQLIEKIKEKIEFFETQENLVDKDKVNKITIQGSLQLANETADRFAENLNNEEIDVTLIDPIKDNHQQTFEEMSDNEVSINQALLDSENKLIERDTEISYETQFDDANQCRKTLLQDYEAWDLEFEKWKNEFNSKLYELFHIIESGSKAVLNGSSKAFLKCLSRYQEEVSEKNDILKEKKNQISLYLNDSNQTLIINYLAQRQKWFDEIFQRIILCRTLIQQNEDDPEVQATPRLPSALADNRAEFNNLLTFYLGATDKYNKFRDKLTSEEAKLTDLNRNFIKLMLGPLDEMVDEANVLSDFSKQLDCVNQLKLAIEQEFQTKQKIKEKLTLLASPEIVKFYLNRIDPYDADSLKNMGNDASTGATLEAIYHNTIAPQLNVCTVPAAFYYSPPLPIIDYLEVIPSQPFYSM